MSLIPFAVTFNSRPHKEVDNTKSGRFGLSTSFNSRPHKEVDHQAGISSLVSLFQFTTSQGGRRANRSQRYNRGGLSIHDLTRRSTHRIQDAVSNRCTFQFTTSQGGRHKEHNTVCIDIDLSIHDLTRRSTPPPPEGNRSERLSIHDLTRRSTDPGPLRRGGLTLSIHDLTRRSTRGWSAIYFYLQTFNSRPHKEVDPSAEKQQARG